MKTDKTKHERVLRIGDTVRCIDDTASFNRLRVGNTYEGTVLAAIIAAVTNRYLADLKPSSIAEIARAIGRPTPSVRRTMKDEDGCSLWLEEGFAADGRTSVYVPRLRYLRDLLLAVGIEKVVVREMLR